MNARTAVSGSAVVVGCGIAGAAAAHRLQRNGFEVTVLEAEPNIGGRTSTQIRDGFTIDLAATMLLSSYRRMVELIAEEGWGSHFAPGSDVIGVEREGTIHQIRASNPLTALRTSLLSPLAKAKLALIALDAVKNRKFLDWEKPVGAADLHYGNAREYADVRVGNSEVRDYLMDPACRFLGLSDLQATNAVDFLFLAKNMGSADLFNSPAGIDTLVRLLTSDVKVETSAEVSSVEENVDGVVVSWSRHGGGTTQTAADVCVIAVPAPIVPRLYPQMGTERAAILDAIVYAPAINVYVGVDEAPLDTSALILIPQVDYPDLACVILDHNKSSGRVPSGKGLISSYWQNTWSVGNWDATDDEITRAALPEIDRLLPGSVDTPVFVHVQRWKHALITGPVGRYRDLERFNALTPAQSRVRFAGDAMSSSTMNSCLCSGERAADELLAGGL